MRLLPLLSVLACEEKLNEWSETSDWGSNVTAASFETDMSGDLSEGEILSSLDWAQNSSVACWPGTEHQNFMGTHVFYSIHQPAHSKLTATVTPQDANVDVNVYILQQGGGSYQIPPDVTSVVTCEVGFPQSTDANPGEEDSAYVVAIQNEYNVLIGVAGPEGASSGAYTLRLSLEDY